MSTPKGTTVIVHSIREKLGIDANQYVFIDAVYQIELSGKTPDKQSVQELCGLEPSEIAISLFKSTKYVLAYTSGQYFTTDEWKKHFNVDADFEEFWKIWQRRGKNKSKTAGKYQKARKKVDKETLHRRAKLVVDNATEWKFIPHAEGWLDGERWNEFNPIFDTSSQTGADDNTPKLVM